MNKLREFIIKFLLLFGVIVVSLYLFYRIQYINITPILIVFGILLLLAEVHTILHLYGMFYALWPRKHVVYRKPFKNQDLCINIFICVCGEPMDVIRKTILAAKESVFLYTQKVKPSLRPRIIVLSDGYVTHKENWHEVAALCNTLGVRHIARSTSGGFKAGNLNFGLSESPANDPHNTIDVVFDSDCVAKPEFLLEIVKPFIDQKIDFVQSPQHYKDPITWIAKSAKAHQMFFFNYLCPAKGYDNAIFLCGTNFAIRRCAIEDAGGFDTRFIAEDYATSIKLHLLGKNGVFMNRVLAEGVAPSTLKDYFSQQQRWSKGTLDASISNMKSILFGSLTWRQKFHYILSSTYYFVGIRDLMLLIAPLPYLFFGISVFKASTLGFVFFVYGPYLLYNFILYTVLFSHPIKSLVINIVTFPVYTIAFLSSIFRKNLAFVVTNKHHVKEDPLAFYRIQLAMVLLLVSGILFSIRHQSNGDIGTFVNYFWSIYSVLVLGFGFLITVKENYDIVLLPASRSYSGRFLLKPAFVFAFILVFTHLASQNVNYIGFAKLSNVELPLIAEKHQELLVPSHGVYYGYYLPELNTHPENPSVGIVENETPTLVMYYQDWGGRPSFDNGFLKRLAKQGVIPIITWEPWDSQKSKDGLFYQTEYSFQHIIEGEYDDYIRTWAKAAASYKKPFFLRFAHEMNGSWYPWGTVNGKDSSELYKKMWIHVHGIFEEEHATNVIWVWAPNNTDGNGKTQSILEFYPGDQYVDWVGYSAFNWGKTNRNTHWTTFKESSDAVYKILSGFNKPVIVAETSSVSTGGDKTKWFEKTLTEDIPGYPNVKAVILFNDNSGRSDFSLSSGMNVDDTVKNYIFNNYYYLKEPLFSYH